MKYQLVLQFAAGSKGDCERLAGLEQHLSDKLGDPAEVDGHDFGSGVFNIFVLTDTPAASFRQAHEIAIAQGISHVMRAAYREVHGENYVILWPASLKEFSVI